MYFKMFIITLTTMFYNYTYADLVIDRWLSINWNSVIVSIFVFWVLFLIFLFLFRDKSKKNDK